MKMIGRTIILLSMTMAFLTACSTPTVSSDDSDENSEKVEQTGDSSSSGIRSDKEANSSNNYDGDDTYFLSATELGSDHIFGIGLGYSTSIVYLTYRKNIGFSVRCLKD